MVTLKKTIKAGFIISAVLPVVFTAWFYIVFIKLHPVNDFKLVSACLTGNLLQLETRESAKYLENCESALIGDTLVINPLTTTIFNPFAKKETRVKIKIRSKTDFIKLGDKVLTKSSIASCQINN